MTGYPLWQLLGSDNTAHTLRTVGTSPNVTAGLLITSLKHDISIRTPPAISDSLTWRGCWKTEEEVPTPGVGHETCGRACRRCPC